jgi:hypothetical protein
MTKMVEDHEGTTVEVVGTITVDRDIAGWCVDDGLTPEQFVLTAMDNYSPIRIGDQVVTFQATRKPAGGATDLCIPAERLQSFWDELRELHTLCIQAPAPKVPVDSLAWMSMGYSKLVGLKLMHVQEYLQEGRVSAPIESWVAATGRLRSVPPQDDR